MARSASQRILDGPQVRAADRTLKCRRCRTNWLSRFGQHRAGSLEVNLTVSDSLYDGRFAKNVWLQELPQAITKICWDNAALVSPKTAEALMLKQGEMVRLVHGGQSLDLPVFHMPGQANGSISVQLGYGRICRDEAVDSDKQVPIGKDVAPIRSFSAMHLIRDVEAKPLPRPYKLATTQDHFAIDELGLETTKQRAKNLIREGTVEQIQEGGKDFVEHLGTHHPALESLWKEPIETLEGDTTVSYQWGMTVDLNKCTGCNACVIACQAENNVPVVGKEQVTRGREMHWLRIDRYFRGDVDTPKIVNQPVACVHCETAPCEQVCPVAATVHTEKASTRWPTTAASARVTVPTTAPTKFAASITSTIKLSTDISTAGSARARSKKLAVNCNSWCSILKSPCVVAV